MLLDSADQKNPKDLISSTDDIAFKEKIFTFFYFIIRRKDINIFFCILLLILETLQILSYGFDEPHTLTWKVGSETMDYITQIVGTPRITPFIKHWKFNYYLIMWGILIGLIFTHVWIIIMTIKFNKVNSTFYKISSNINRLFACCILVVGAIPVSEIVLVMLKCKNNNVDFVSDSIPCWDNLHIWYGALSIVFYILFNMILIFNTIFYFDPFNTKNSTVRIDTTADIFFLILKIVNILRFIFLSNEWWSIVIIWVGGLFNLKIGYETPSFRNWILQCIVSIRNASFLWMGIMLFICKVTETSNFNGNIFLLCFGFPLIIFSCVILYKKESKNFWITNSNIVELNDYWFKIKNLIYWIENFISTNKASKNNKKGYNKNDIYLQGYISMHNEKCIWEECPLTKFNDSVGNFNIQKTSWLHYMNILFLEGIKKFPTNKKIIMTFIQFNYHNKFNLNAAKTYLAKLEKENNTLNEDYIWFCIQQTVNAFNNKPSFNSNNDNDEMAKIEDTTDQKFRKLKYWIETTTKLYGEFWAILATNLTNNLNLKKLYFVGNKLNELWDEINKLWEQDLKTKKIELENQSIVQWYAYFIREILCNKLKSEEISKKINEEQHYESKKNDTDKFDWDNLDVILENQEYTMFCRTNDKGECTILQCSNSIVSLLGFTKQDLICQKIDIMIPGIFISDHSKMIVQKIKSIRGNIGTCKSNDKKQLFILAKTKVGYLLPLQARFSIYSDDDFSNTFIIKSKFENKDSKSIYAFYILTKEDFTIDSFSSSTLTMGLTMDLLKKYVVNLTNLVRSEDLENWYLNERYIDYEEEPRKVAWVFPDKIYPKNDSFRSNEEDVEKLIHQSKTKIYNLWITKLKIGDDDTIGYCFRFTSLENLKTGCDSNDYNHLSSRHIMYDIFNWKYVRTIIVNEKKNPNQDYFAGTILNNWSSTKPVTKMNKELKQNKKKSSICRRRSINNSIEYEEDSEKGNEEEVNIWTKEKILELIPKGSDEIKEFIESLKFYGNDVSLERHRPNKERYPTGKISEPLIKINSSHFIKRIEDKLKAHPDLSREKRAKHSDGSLPTPSGNVSKGSSQISSYNADSSLSGGSEINSDISFSIGHIFNGNSVTYIKIMSFIMFVIICAMWSLEFCISWNNTIKCGHYVEYMDKAYIILNAFLYTKFYITEALLAQDQTNYLILNGLTQKDYIESAMKEMSDYKEIISSTYAEFLNAPITFSEEYTKYWTEVEVKVYTWSNNQPSEEILSFSNAMSRIPTNIFYVSTINDNYQSIDKTDRNVHEWWYNLLNDYLIVWRSITFILVQDTKDNAVPSKVLIFIYGFSFLIFVISWYLLWKLISRFIDDREKPVDWFLTIKKQKFEELKNTCEAFLNKWLNKFFGNEETEEESMVEYKSVSKTEEIIMITKFKQKTEYKQSVRTSSEYLWNFIKMVLFFLIIEIYMSFKYFYIDSIMDNINKYADIYNITHYSQSDLILSTNIFKSYYLDPDIPILARKDTETIFERNFIQLTDEFEKLYFLTYDTNSFLSRKYVNFFYQVMTDDITGIGNGKYNEMHFKGALLQGFSSVSTRFFELSKYVAWTYISSNGVVTPPAGNFCYSFQYEEINEIVTNVIRAWYNNWLKELKNTFKNYKDNSILIQDTIFILLIVAVLVLYLLVWKSYEDKLNWLLKTSVDLINLIPEEIKCEIVKKLNEEDEKNNE